MRSENLRGALGDLVRVEEADDDRALALGEGDGLAHRLERLRGRADAGDEEVGDRRLRPRPRTAPARQLAAEEAERRAVVARPLRRHAEAPQPLALGVDARERRRRAPLRRQRERRRQRRVQRGVRLRAVPVELDEKQVVRLPGVVEAVRGELERRRRRVGGGGGCEERRGGERAERGRAAPHLAAIRGVRVARGRELSPRRRHVVMATNGLRSRRRWPPLC